MIYQLPLDRITGHPLFGLALTIGIYVAAVRLHVRAGKRPMVHPVLTSVALVSIVIWSLGIDYARYFAAVAPLHLALGVFVVLLAVPLVRRWGLIRMAGPGILIALLFGSAAAVTLAASISSGLAADSVLTASLAPKSASAPVALGIAERLGGIGGLAAMLAVLTGTFGAVAGPGLLAAAGVRDERAAGFALGVVSHAIGTARAFQISEIAGAFASLGMVLNAILTVALAPLLLHILAG